MIVNGTSQNGPSAQTRDLLGFTLHLNERISRRQKVSV